VLRREPFKVMQIVDGGREVVLSRRALREGAVRERAEEAIKSLKVGDRVTGRVVSVRDHGIFVDLGGVEGRIQLGEMSHDRGARPQDIAKVGDEIEALVLRIDIPTPAAEAPAAEGLATEAPAEAAEAPPRTEAPAAEGEARGEGRRDRDRKKARPSRQPEGTPRVELSRRAVEPDPWGDVHKRYPHRQPAQGQGGPDAALRRLHRARAGVDGLLHVSEIGDKRINHPNEVLQEGQEVTVRVAKIDRASAASPSPRARGRHRGRPQGLGAAPCGHRHHGQDRRARRHRRVGPDSTTPWARSGARLIPPPDSAQPRGTDLKKAIPVGSDVKVKIVELDRGRLKLSIRAALQDEERQAYRAYQQQANSHHGGRLARRQAPQAQPPALRLRRPPPSPSDSSRSGAAVDAPRRARSPG
jgi:small subunit ribosomal protein S1